MSRTLSRRVALAGLFAFSAGAAAARPQRVAPQGGIRVDVGPLVANDGATIAGWVARLLPLALAEAFAARGLRGAQVSVRVDYVMLTLSTGSAGPAGRSHDEITGEATVNGVTRPVRATASYYPSAFDQPNFEQANFDRVQQLCEAFAYWIALGA